MPTPKTLLHLLDIGQVVLCTVVGATLHILHDFDSLEASIEGEGKCGGGSSRMFPLKCFTDVDWSLRRQ